MPERRRKYTPEFKDEAAKMVIETSRPIAEIAREISLRPRMAASSRTLVAGGISVSRSKWMGWNFRGLWMP